MDDLLQKLKKVVCIVLYGPAISQSDCRKLCQRQFSSNNTQNIPDESTFMKQSLATKDGSFKLQSINKLYADVSFVNTICNYFNNIRIPGIK